MLKVDSELKLTIEFVPSTAWYMSIYQLCRRNNQFEIWKKIKKDLIEKEGKKCWICGKENTVLEAHEFWEYDDIRHIQRLVAIHHLCSMCHKVKHVGLWLHTEVGRKRLAQLGLSREDIIQHFCKINNCSQKDFEEHEIEAFKIWKKRSRYNWKQDFGKYQKYFLKQTK